MVRRRLPARDFTNPEHRSGTRFLGWLLWQQLPLLLLSSLISVIEWLPGSVGPYLVGKIVDEGIIPHDLATVGKLSLIMFGLVLTDHRQRAEPYPCGADVAGCHVRRDEARDAQNDSDGARSSGVRRPAKCSVSQPATRTNSGP